MFDVAYCALANAIILITLSDERGEVVVPRTNQTTPRSTFPSRQAEADRMSGKFQLADLEPPATAEKTPKNEENKEEEAKEEVKLNIPTEALPAGRALNIFEKPSTNIFNTPTSEATASSKVSENIFMQARTEKSFVNVFYNKASVNLFALK